MRSRSAVEPDAPGIGYLDGRRFRRVLLAGVQRVVARREELDRINVFPVPDGDTGTNLALTLRSVAAAIAPVRSRSLHDVADAAAEASVVAARGNSGMLFSHLLLEFSDAVGTRCRASTEEVADAFSAAAGRLALVLESPREGTIVSVAREMAAAGTGVARVAGRPPGPGLGVWLDEVRAAGARSLAATREQLPELREAGVVDAGALGLVEFFDGVARFVEEGGVPERPDVPAGGGREGADGRPSLYAARESGVGAGEGRYCTQVVLRGDLPETIALRGALAGLGTSTIVARAGNVAKVHIHADAPERVVAALERFGAIESRRFEDTTLVGASTHHTAVVTDSAADLPHAWVERHGVRVVPLQVIVGDRVYRDGVDLQPDELFGMMADPSIPLPKTSQPPPAAFRAACRAGLEHGAEALLGVFVSGALSGTFSSAVAVFREFEAEAPAVAVDSRSATLGVGLLVIRAIELLQNGLSPDEAAAELRRVRDRSDVFFTVDTMEHLLRSGRIGRTRAWLGDLLMLKPILSLTREGGVVPVGRARGRKAVLERVLSRIDDRVAGAREYRFGVAHFGAPDTAREIARRLRARYAPKEILVGPASAALGVHTGPGAWALACQVEDGDS